MQICKTNHWSCSKNPSEEMKQSDDGERVKESAKDDPSGRSTRGSDGRSTMPAGGRHRTGVGSRQRSASVCVGSSYPSSDGSSDGEGPIVQEGRRRFPIAAMERVRSISLVSFSLSRDGFEVKRRSGFGSGF
ncbi:hypothetical protein LXL04_018223 [Taraxacum kok-saghyz]